MCDSPAPSHGGGKSVAQFDGRNVGPTVRTLRFAGSVSLAASATGVDGGAGGAAFAVGLSGLPSGPVRGCDNCFAFCSVTTTSPSATVVSGPIAFSASAQLSPACRQLQEGVIVLR